MILTWNEIVKERTNWNIIISPFSKEQVNPNSYNYRLWEYIKIYKSFDWEKPVFEDMKIPKNGLKLNKWFMYLWSTKEIIWSKKYMTSLIWKSSLWRLGLFLQLSANVWHTWTFHNWTLEIYPTKDIIVYPNMIIWQVTFWKNKWELDLYKWEYKKYSKPQESLLSK